MYVYKGKPTHKIAVHIRLSNCIFGTWNFWWSEQWSFHHHTHKFPFLVPDGYPQIKLVTLQGMNISHLGKRKIIFKSALVGIFFSLLEGTSFLLNDSILNEQWSFQPASVGRIWGFPKIVVPPNLHFNRVFHYKPSILGNPYFWKHPYGRWNATHLIPVISWEVFICRQSTQLKTSPW